MFIRRGHETKLGILKTKLKTKTKLELRNQKKLGFFVIFIESNKHKCFRYALHLSQCVVTLLCITLLCTTSTRYVYTKIDITCSKHKLASHPLPCRVSSKISLGALRIPMSQWRTWRALWRSSWQRRAALHSLIFFVFDVRVSSISTAF